MSIPPGPSQATSARRSRTEQRRRRSVLTAGLAIVVVAGVVVAVVSRGSSPAGHPPAHDANGASTSDPRGHPRTASAHTPAATAAAAAIESGLLPWQLAQPTSRAVAVAAPGGGKVVALGGLTSALSSSASVVSVGVPGGTSAPAGSLVTATHDAAGTVVGSRVLLFGGGAATTVGAVQSLPLGPLVSGGASVAASVAGQLPQPRSDAAAVTIGGTAYVIGGYDGTRADPEVLATTDGAQVPRRRRAAGAGALPGRGRARPGHLRLRRRAGRRRGRARSTRSSGSTPLRDGSR